MNLTDIHKNRHLTQTVLQLAFSLHSVSVSYLCSIHKHHIYIYIYIWTQTNLVVVQNSVGDSGALQANTVTLIDR